MRKNNPLRLYLKKRAPSLFRGISHVNQRIRWFFIWRRAGLPLREELAARRALKTAWQVRPLPDTQANHRAVLHVGTKAEEGIAQLGILIHHGCKPEHVILEIGCGALNAGYPIMQYVDAGKYVGIDPETWATSDSLKVPEVAAVVKHKRARFGGNDAFDASEFNTKFDYVISHSILSHAAHWQLPLFLKNVGVVLKPGGKILASLYFNTGNSYGAITYPGTEKDFTTWQYPNTSFFQRSTIFNLARQHGYSVREDLVAPFLITRAHPSARHSWIILEKQ